MSSSRSGPSRSGAKCASIEGTDTAGAYSNSWRSTRRLHPCRALLIVLVDDLDTVPARRRKDNSDDDRHDVADPSGISFHRLPAPVAKPAQTAGGRSRVKQ